MANEDGVAFAAQLVYQHQGERRGDRCPPSLCSQESIGGLGPFQRDIGPLKRVVGEETLVDLPARALHHTHHHLDASRPHPLDAAPLHLGEGIDAAADHTPHALADDQIGTGWRLAIVATRFQRDVDRALSQQRFVLGPHRGKGVDLGVALATALMVALADDAPAGSYDHRTDHGVGLGARLSAARQLQAAPHIQFVRFSLHSFLLLRG